MISVIHATRGRPAKALATRADYLDKSRGPVEHIFVVDEDDVTAAALLGLERVLVVPPAGCNAAFNAGAREAEGEVLMIAADDVVPPARWDELVLERLGDVSVPRVLAVSDGHRRDRLIAHPILTRARFEQQGRCVFWPGYETVYADTDFTAWAYRDGVVLEARDLVFEHAHPSYGRAEWDEGYRRQNAPATYARGRALLEERFPGFVL